MRKILNLAFISLFCTLFYGCIEKEDIVTLCAKGKIVDYNCGRMPIVQVLTPGIKIGIKTTLNNSTIELENIIQINNLAPQYNQLNKEFYFTFKLAKEEEKDKGLCPATYVPYDVPQMMVINVSELPCEDNDWDDDDWDDWDD